MSNTVLVIGQSGSGKSTSLRNLNPVSTFIINILDKPLPFRGFKKNYKLVTKENPTGNYFSASDWSHVVRCIDMVDKTRPDITTLVIDDWQYILAYEFMRRVSEKGFEKFSELAVHGWSTINACLGTRPSLTNFILSHSDMDNTGRAKCKTIGKLLDEKITIEGLFTTVLHSRVVDGEYMFQTQSDNDYLAKSPMSMFEDFLIPNDLVMVKAAVENYFNEEE
jgi:energy-coupling factor transporter ATP-binding protein EcfA2